MEGTMTKLLKIITGAGSSIVVYLATLLGVLLSQYAPLLISHEPISTPFEWIRLGISAAMAFYLVVGQERGGDDEGKQKNFKRRVANAISHGIAWNSVIGIAGAAASAQ